MSDPYLKYYNLINKANLQSAKQQMDFQKEMSNTSHQREVKDLIKAGLNPVLSANNGASTPGGSYANVDSSAISAKFARSQANAEMRNQLKITAMNNASALRIAKAQIAGQIAMNDASIALQKWQWLTPSGNNTQTTESTPLGLGASVVKAITEGTTGLKSSSVADTLGKIFNPNFSARNGNKTPKTAAEKLGRYKNVKNFNYKQFMQSMYNSKKGYVESAKNNVKGKDLSNFVGDLGYIPKGKLYDSNGKPLSAKEAQKYINSVNRTYNYKSKASRSNFAKRIYSNK